MNPVIIIGVTLSILIGFAKSGKLEPSFSLRARWCTISQAELEKCNELVQNLKDVSNAVLNSGDEKEKAAIKEFPVFVCVRGFSTGSEQGTPNCVEKIEKNKADLVTLDSGQAYFAGRHHNLVPIMAEHYSTDLLASMSFEAVAVVKKSNRKISIQNLAGFKSCHPHIGDSAGWVYPIGRLMELGHIVVNECNSPVKSVTNYFTRGMCLPGAINSFYNTYGNNPVKACENCKGEGDNWCAAGDPYAGYDGAFKCLHSGSGDIAFIRHDTIPLMKERTNLDFEEDKYELLCPDGSRRPVSEYSDCSWGSPKSQIVMTSGTKVESTIAAYKKLLKKISYWFGETGTHASKFRVFRSKQYLKDNRLNLMFNDATKLLVDVGQRDSYYTWVDAAFLSRLESINRCPLRVARWCVISLEEKSKCEDMLMAFKARGLKPELDCVYGVDTTVCMRMIRFDQADMMSLDAADLYYGGRIYSLVPIAKEDYGDMTGKYRVVAVTRKTNSYLTIFNLKGRRTCHGGVRTGDGFVIPAHILMETTQIRPEKCSLYENMGELFAQSCIPGVLEKEYNPKKIPVNLCESCASGGYRKCQRNSRELYYKSTGAFRCLVENGGDVAFVRHLTVQDNTDGKNQAIWARNRRSDDYELMCKDGSRRPINEWRRCSLGVVPANVVVTAKHKTQQERDIYWNVLNYAQMFFSSDSESDFSMFDSGIVYNDLLFSDASVRLLHIPREKQNYEKYLGVEFKYSVESLLKYTCDLDEDDIEKYEYSDSTAISAFNVLTSTVVLLVTVFMLR